MDARRTGGGGWTRVFGFPILAAAAVYGNFTSSAGSEGLGLGAQPKRNDSRVLKSAHMNNLRATDVAQTLSLQRRDFYLDS